jgi:hypothetical protein
MTQEQADAQNALERAIVNHVQAFRSEFAENPEMVGDWMLIAAVASLDGTEQRTAYHLGFSGGEMEEHRAYGLLRTADKLLAEGIPA